MALFAFFCAFLASDLHWTSAAPIINTLQDHWLISAFPSERSSTTLNVSVQDTVPYTDIESFLLLPPSTPIFSTEQLDITPQDEPYPFSFSLTHSFTSELSSESFVVTLTITKEEPTTIILSAAPTTITKLVTITASPTPTSLPSTPSTPPDKGLGSAKASWAAPSDMKDLTSFNVLKFDGGVQNMKIVTAIPAEAITSPEDSDSSRSSNADFHPTGAMMQILYPENSINPAQKPQGGAEFYASPIDISDARNVTLEYSVFFPFDFDWVLAGKLPGLYGGHEGCSGGNAALDCFSTRLMWRKGGAGELYLYAPKDKQTDKLCSDPASVCDAAYGLSIGRGAFSWKAGAWTTVKQTVCLNTPGEQDGTFALDVDGERAIYREDVFYRENLTTDKGDSKHGKSNHIPTKTSTKKHADPPSSTDDGGLLGPILGGILGRPLLRSVAEEAIVSFYRLEPTSTQDTDNDDEGSFMMIDAVLPRPTPNHPEQTNVVATLEDGSTSGTEYIKVSEVKFAGIFFSTFFGGHDEKYATPKDQYVWFKDFALAYNS